MFDAKNATFLSMCQFLFEVIVIFKTQLPCCFYLPENFSARTSLSPDEKVAAILFGDVLYTSHIFIHNCSIEFIAMNLDNVTAPILILHALLQHDQAMQLHCRPSLVFLKVCVLVESWLFWFADASLHFS